MSVALAGFGSVLMSVEMLNEVSPARSLAEPVLIVEISRAVLSSVVLSMLEVTIGIMMSCAEGLLTAGEVGASSLANSA